MGDPVFLFRGNRIAAAKSLDLVQNGAVDPLISQKIDHVAPPCMDSCKLYHSFLLFSIPGLKEEEK
jgi:hypothetical protein